MAKSTSVTVWKVSFADQSGFRSVKIRAESRSAAAVIFRRKLQETGRTATIKGISRYARMPEFLEWDNDVPSVVYNNTSANSDIRRVGLREFMEQYDDQENSYCDQYDCE